MIERFTGDDADLIIEDRWPHSYNEDQIIASARHHREVVAAEISGVAQPYLNAARTEADTANAGMFAQAVVTKTADHMHLADQSALRHSTVAEHLDTFATAIINAKNRINGAVSTFTADWAKAPQLAQANNWYQHEYNSYRTQLVEAGRASVTAALSDLTAAHDTCSTVLQAALD
ncbi:MULTISPECIES: hypothetical protein [Mycobacteriaceae]|uniref:hypothetical protein n=1 Tax=Mycobacteriaceae TaxID=1762 RepID=UPI0007EA871C|nr:MULTISPECIES: hypothetical protein [Mycobacteriaceae]OBF76603.1 hypothetical protein A5751_24130 [Mycolicibacterium fortuitum]TMS50223.1 hypothetical protein E0T84_24415 [Mycobacterium sp. DBP42]